METPRYPANETERIAALRSYAVLDTACEAAFDNIAELAAMLTGTPMSAVSLVDSERQWFKARFGTEATQTPREISFCAHAILNPSEPFIVDDAALDPRFADNPLVVGPPRLRFYAGVPLVTPAQAVLGTLCVMDRQPRQLSGLERVALARLADSVMTTLELRRAMMLLHHCAVSDSLTGLPNRAALLDALETTIAQQRRTGGVFCLMMVDLDGFKAVNDRHGHAVGDEVLREVANRLRGTLRSEDSAARLGGDEFALLAACDEDGAALLAARFHDQLAEASAMLPWRVTASIGIVCLREPPADADEALRRADAAMYGAKAAGKNRTCIAPAPAAAALAAATVPLALCLEPMPE